MGDCSIKVSWVKNPTYEDVKKLYESFEDTTSKMECSKLLLSFNFSCGSIRYTAESMEEFIEKAFGEHNFKLIALQFTGMLNGGESVRINYLNNLSVSASSKVLLESFKNRLNLDAVFYAEMTEAQGNPAVDMQPHAVISTTTSQGPVNSPITINGSGNILNVAGGSITENQIEIEQKRASSENKPSNIKSFISGVLQGVTVNAVWYILVLIGTAILGYFALK